MTDVGFAPAIASEMSITVVSPLVHPMNDCRPISAVGRVFVVGCPRSGTTLLQGILSAHPDVWSLPETHFFEMLEPGRRLPRAMGLASRRGWRAFCQTANDLGEPLPKPWQLNYWWRDSLAKRFVSLFDAKTLAAGKRLWVEKTLVMSSMSR